MARGKELVEGGICFRRWSEVMVAICAYNPSVSIIVGVNGVTKELFA